MDASQDPTNSGPIPLIGRTASGLLNELAAYACFLLAFAYGFYRIGLGINIRDEGMYLTAPMRYALGDVPFHDEFINPHRMFDIVLWPLYEIYHDITVYQLRLAWLVVQLCCVIALYRVFSRFAPKLLVAAACVATLYLPNLIWTPAYHLMGTFLFVLAWSLMFEGFVTNRLYAQIVLGFLSGGIFFIGALSYLPLLGLTIVPLAMLVGRLLRGRNQAGITRVLAVHLATITTLVVASIASFAVLGLIDDWWSASEKMMSSRLYRTTIVEKAVLFLNQTTGWWDTIGIMALATAGTILVVRWLSRTRHPFYRALGTGLLAAALSSVVYLIVHPAGTSLGPGYYALGTAVVLIGVSLGNHLGALLMYVWNPMARLNPMWSRVYCMTFAASLLLGFLHGYLSAMAVKALFAVVPLFVTGAVLSYRAVRDADPRRPQGTRAAVIIGAMCAVVAAESYLKLERAVRAKPKTVEFSHVRLAGIKFSEENEALANLGSVAAYLEERVERGDFLLVDGHAPILYYLTETRPAVDYSFPSRTLPTRIFHAAVDKMIAEERIPEYAVRPLIDKKPLGVNAPVSAADDPIGAFIWDHYERIKRFGPFVVWKLEDDSFPVEQGHELPTDRRRNLKNTSEQG